MTMKETDKVMNMITNKEVEEASRVTFDSPQVRFPKVVCMYSTVTCTHTS